MDLILLIVVAAAMLALGYFLGRNSRNTQVADMKAKVEEEKSRAQGIMSEFKSDKSKVAKLNNRYDGLLKEKNALADELKKAQNDCQLEKNSLKELKAEHSRLQMDLKEVQDVWGEKLDAANAERDNVIRLRDEDAIEWARRMDEQSNSAEDVGSKLKSKNARIDELNALLVDSQKKVERHDAKHKKEIEKLKADLRQANKRKSGGNDAGSSKKKEAPATVQETASPSVSLVSEPLAAETKVEVEPEVIKEAVVEQKEAPKPVVVSSTDDLTKIEGVGPKIASILTEGGLATFSAVAEAQTDAIKELLVKAGPAYQRHNPHTWPRQAALAAKGEWDELKKWQDELDGGKE